MEPFLRKQGMPVRLNKGALSLPLSLSLSLSQTYTNISLPQTYTHKISFGLLLMVQFLRGAGVVELVSDFVVCEEGKPISPEASRILVSFLNFKYF